MALTCPKGMVLIDKGGSIHPDEPAYCIDETEVTRRAYNLFSEKQLKKGYELLVNLINGDGGRYSDASRHVLEKKATELILGGGVSTVEIRPINADRYLKWTKDLKKPVSGRTWYEAKEYCGAAYKGGNLPTHRQWTKACGSKKYCTASGELNPEEAIYLETVISRAMEQPFAEVGSTKPNKKGVYDMTGNVSEWIRDDARGSLKCVRGGSWDDLPDMADEWLDASRYFRISADSPSVGIRCVAPPLGKAEESPESSGE